MDRAYLEWNLPNWITVVLMATVGMMLVGFVNAALKQLTTRAGTEAA